ncbi:MAG: ribosomal protection-like ABC-F family protein [Anaerolineae bacterium]
MGKTSLLMILAGLTQPAGGELFKVRALSVGYLRQEAVLAFADQNHTLYEEMLTVFADLQGIEKEMRRLEAAMADAADERVLERYGRLQSDYEHGGGYQYQVEIKLVLLGLGFAETDWQTSIAHLSGGQKTRLLLGRLLLEKPDLLILDEPTNHLDLTAVQWLERTLHKWQGALIIVSHDRYFLDRVVNRIWAMTPTGFRVYRGDYTSYARQREAEIEREQKLFVAAIERLEKELEFVRKHIAGGQSDLAKGKLKRLTRDLVLLEQASEGESLASLQGKSWLDVGGRVRTLSANEAAQRLRHLHSPYGRGDQMRIKLRAAERSGRLALRTGELTIGYPGRPLFTTEKLQLERWECAAILGDNGSGKSTFLGTVMGGIRPSNGWIKFGDNVKTGYFAQGHDQLTLTHRVIDEVMRCQPMAETAARNFLAQYLFRGHDVFKKVADLSGGERGRLALAALALAGANFLLLDEPTNHLDILSQESLQTALESFDGTILLVSHDRYLIDRLATQIWEIRDGRLRVFAGTYTDFLLAQTNETESEIDISELDWVAEIEPLPAAKMARRERQTRQKELLHAIEAAEDWLDQLADELARAQAGGDTMALSQLRDEQTVMAARLAALTAEWEALSGL